MKRKQKKTKEKKLKINWNSKDNYKFVSWLSYPILFNAEIFDMLFQL